MCNYNYILFGSIPQKTQMQKCKNAKMQILQCYRAVSRLIVPYRSISRRIAPYRASRQKAVVPLHCQNKKNAKRAVNLSKPGCKFY